jgi:hypothetical protein
LLEPIDFLWVLTFLKEKFNFIVGLYDFSVFAEWGISDIKYVSIKINEMIWIM